MASRHETTRAAFRVALSCSLALALLCASAAATPRVPQRAGPAPERAFAGKCKARAAALHASLNAPPVGFLRQRTGFSAPFSKTASLVTRADHLGPVVYLRHKLDQVFDIDGTVTTASRFRRALAREGRRARKLRRRLRVYFYVDGRLPLVDLQKLLGGLPRDSEARLVVIKGASPLSRLQPGSTASPWSRHTYRELRATKRYPYAKMWKGLATAAGGCAALTAVVTQARPKGAIGAPRSLRANSGKALRKCRCLGVDIDGFQLLAGVMTGQPFILGWHPLADAAQPRAPLVLPATARVRDFVKALDKLPAAQRRTTNGFTLR